MPRKSEIREPIRQGKHASQNQKGLDDRTRLEKTPEIMERMEASWTVTPFNMPCRRPVGSGDDPRAVGSPGH